jgi:cytidylate kinase
MNRIICVSGGIASGKTTLCAALAESIPGAQRLSFGDVVRLRTRAQGLELTRENLQKVGEQCISEGWPAFVDAMLSGLSSSTDVLIVDGVRHLEPVLQLREIFPAAPLTLAFLRVEGEELRKRLDSRGESATAQLHPVEADLEIVHANADLQLDSGRPIGQLVSQVVSSIDTAR